MELTKLKDYHQVAKIDDNFEPRSSWLLAHVQVNKDNPGRSRAASV
jgi:hypothetical protein